MAQEEHDPEFQSRLDELSEVYGDMERLKAELRGLKARYAGIISTVVEFIEATPELQEEPIPLDIHDDDGRDFFFRIHNVKKTVKPKPAAIPELLETFLRRRMGRRARRADEDNGDRDNIIHGTPARISSDFRGFLASQEEVEIIATPQVFARKRRAGPRDEDENENGGGRQQQRHQRVSGRRRRGEDDHEDDHEDGEGEETGDEDRVEDGDGDSGGTMGAENSDNTE